MEKTYHYIPKGVCAAELIISYDDENMTVTSYKSIHGCPGNSQGVGALIVGMKIDEAAKRLKGIRCREKSTSCPDQLGHALDEILALEAK